MPSLVHVHLLDETADLDGDFLNEGTRPLTQLAVELEAEQVIGAGGYEWTENRRTYRNGHRERTWPTRVG